MLSRKTFNDLAKKNVKKSAKDYLIYFFTVTFAVCLFYTFNSMRAQLDAMGVKDTLNYMTASTAVLTGISIFICLIMGFLVAYANQFLLKRRKREIGIYMTLGMNRKAINRLLVKESTIIGFASLIAGLALGLFTSQGLSMVSAKVIGVGDGRFHFILSPGAALASIVFFGIMFLCVHFFNARQVKKMRLIELIYADRKNEAFPGNRIRGIVFLILSLFALTGGFVITAKPITDEFLKNSVIVAILICCGIFFFILSVADIFLPLMKKNKMYLKGLNMVVISQLSSRLKSAGLSTAVVSIMLFLSLVTMSVGMGLGNNFMKNMRSLTPYDASITWYNDAQNFGQTMEQAMKKQGITQKDLGQEASLIDVYYLEKGKDEVFPMIGEQDYNKAMKLQGKEELKLSENQFAVVFSDDSDQKQYESSKNSPKGTIEIRGTSLKQNGTYISAYQNTNVSLGTGTLILPDRVLKDMDPQYTLCNVNFGDTVSDADQWFLQMRDKLSTDFRINTKNNIIVEATSNQIMTTYVGIYFGVSFLITAGAVLAIQQLSQSADNRKMYNLMRKMGTGQRALKRSILAQIGIYFGLPLSVSVITAGGIIGSIFGQIPELSGLAAVQSVLFPAGLTAVIYSIYFVTTYVGSKQMLKL